MLDTVQFILLFVIVILTILLLILGVQVFLILRDLRKTITKANKVLDNAGTITDSVRGPLTSLSSIATGIKAGSFLTLARFLKSILSREKEEEDYRHKKRES